MKYGSEFLKEKSKAIYQQVVVFKDWHKVMFPFNRFHRGRQTLHLRNGFPITIHDIFSSELPFVVSFFYTNEYRLNTVSLPANPIIVDLGANMGAFTIDAKVHFPSLEIIAYEPHPKTFELLKQNAPFAELHQEAAAGTGGAVQIQADGAPLGRTLVETGGISVKAKTLDEILASLDHVDLLKVDIEGAEFDLFEKAAPETIAKIRCCIVELHANPWGSRNHWAEEFFTPHGFQVEWMYSWGVLKASRVESS